MQYKGLHSVKKTQPLRDNIFNVSVSKVQLDDWIID